MKENFWEYFLKRPDLAVEEEDDEGGSSGSKSGGEGGRVTYLEEESEWMGYARRGLEQHVERQLSQVEERRKPQRENTGNEPGLEQKLKQHPLLDSQRFDGIDPGLNPAPFGNEEALIAFENERREQEKEKQLRLGNVPKMGNSYVPELKR